MMAPLVLVALTVFVTGFPTPAQAQSQAESLPGAWREVEVEVMGGPNAGVTDVEENGSLWVFSDRYHSLNAVVPGQVRPDPSDDPTREERSRLFRTYVAFAGTWELEGSTLSLAAEVKLDPSAPDTLTREITLTDTTLEARTTEDGVVTARRYVRVD
ncbi:MAG: hypothetical protein ACOC8K_08395 [Gemmatimonadota bacterium]